MQMKCELTTRMKQTTTTKKWFEKNEPMYWNVCQICKLSFGIHFTQCTQINLFLPAKKRRRKIGAKNEQSSPAKIIHKISSSSSFTWCVQMCSNELQNHQSNECSVHTRTHGVKSISHSDTFIQAAKRQRIKTKQRLYNKLSLPFAHNLPKIFSWNQKETLLRADLNSIQIAIVSSLLSSTYTNVHTNISYRHGLALRKFSHKTYFYVYQNKYTI